MIETGEHLTVTEQRVEGWEYEYAFHRIERRKTKLKRPCDCGCVIDGGEPYRYTVYKLNGDVELTQFVDCEFCARNDERY